MSNETKWTKGPWQRSPSNESGGSFIEHIDADYVSHIVAFVHASHGMFDDPLPTEEDAANAHLIAAAPELYEALEDLVDATYGFYPFDEGGHPCVVAALASLAKARGETS